MKTFNWDSLHIVSEVQSNIIMAGSTATCSRYGAGRVAESANLAGDMKLTEILGSIVGIRSLKACLDSMQKLLVHFPAAQTQIIIQKLY